jgi:hypothetical protein
MSFIKSSHFLSVHYPEKYIENEMASPVGVSEDCKYKIVARDELHKEFFDHYTFQEFNYVNAKGHRTQNTGLVAEVIDPVGSNSILFVSRADQFVNWWCFSQQKLLVRENKIGRKFIC